MKKYLLFACPQYYPNGGWKDYKSESDDMQELIDMFDKNCQEDEYEWATGHILDWDTKKIIIEAWSDRKYDKNNKSSGVQTVWSKEYL